MCNEGIINNVDTYRDLLITYQTLAGIYHISTYMQQSFVSSLSKLTDTIF